MLKNLLFIAAFAIAAPSAMASDSMSNLSNSIAAGDDDRDDDDDKYDIGLHRPVIECRNISKKSADLVLRVRVHNRTKKSVTAIVQVEVEDKEGKKVAFVNDKVIIPAGKTVVSKNVVTLKNPKLHSANPSYRYEAEAEVISLKGEELSRSKETKFFISRNYGAARKHPGSVLKGREIPKKLQKTAR